MIIKSPAPSQIHDLRRLWQQAFGDTEEYLDVFWQTAFSPDRCRCLVTENRLAAALYWLDCACRGKKLAYLYAVATEEAFRGQGLCHRLMADTHAHLAAQGYAGAALVPGSEALFRLYADMGYRPFGGIRAFTAVANTPAAVLRQISAQEYAVLRKSFLPEGSVLQEGQTLAFLQTQVSFYAGEGFVLAAATDGGHAFVPELLGNAPAENITAALGVKTAAFRAPGEAPFAMYLPFTQDAPPAYFGFALD